MKKLAIFLFTILTILLAGINVNAVENTVLTSDKTEATLGEEIMISINLTGDTKSLIAYTAKLSYDKEVFEIIETENFQGQDNWADITYNKSNNKFSLIHKNETSDENHLQIKFKVRDDAVPGKTNITINSITASDGNKDISLNGNTIEVTIIKEGLTDGESIPTDKNQISSNEENIAIDIKKDISWVAYILIVLIILIISFTIYYYRKSNEKRTPKNKRNIIMIIAILLVIVLFAISINILSNKKADVNKDGKIDYEDTKDIIEYLLEINKAEEDENISDKDINNDGQITITDVVLSTNQANNQNYSTNSGNLNNNSNNNGDSTTTPDNSNNPEDSDNEQPINAKIINCKIMNTSGEEVFYVAKSQKLKAIYTIETNIKEDISFITVNSVKLPVNKNTDGSYTVSFNAPANAGEIEIQASKIEFGINRESNVSYSSKIDVLKSIKPTVKNVKVDDTKEKPVLTYEIEDPEDTFIAGKITIIDAKTQEFQEIQITDKAQTRYILENIKELTKYSIKFEFTYDLDANKEDKTNQAVETIEGNQFEVIKDYDFKLENFVVTKIDRAKKQIVLQFTSTNATENYVSEVTINGMTYKVTKAGITYAVTIPYESETRTVLELQKAKLNNLHEFENLQNKLLIFKTVPTANVEAQTDSEQKAIKLKIDLFDEDSTITNLEARLINPKGKVISTKSLNKDTKEVIFESENEAMFKSGKYIVEIGADYEVVDGLTHNKKETIGNSEITIQTKASITKAEVQNYYVEKGKNVDIKYTFISNNENKPTGININDTFYSATENNDGTITVSIPAETTNYGEKKYTVTIAMFGNETVILESTQDANYYLLKDRPSIEKYAFNESAKNQTLEFGLKNSENSIIKDAKVILKNEAMETVLSKQLNTQIQKDEEIVETVIELSKVPNGIYTLSLSGTYDLDDDENNNENIHNLSDIFEQRKIQVTSTYTAELSITNVEVKDYKAIVTFTSTNSSNATVEYIVVDGEKFPVTRQEDSNTYIAEIPHQYEQNQIKKITAVVLANDIDITLTQEQSYEVFKTKPIVTDIITKQDGNNLSVNFTFNDLASIAKNAKVVIKKDNNVVQLKDITIKDTNVVFENITQAGTYTIEFLADYDRADGKKHNQDKINVGNVTYKVSIKTTVELLKDLFNEYPERNTELAITYHITSNTEEPITAITVDGKEYSQEEFEVSNGNYVIKVMTPNKSEEKIYQVTSIKYADDTIAVNNNEAKIFVLKTAPKVTNFNFDKKEKTIAFKLENPENATVKGRVTIKSLDGKVVYQYPEDLKNDENTIDLTKLDGFDETVTYQVVLEGTYDLDNNELNGKNEYSLADLLKEEIQIRIGTDISFDRFSTRYPEKGKNVEITFNVTSDTTIPVTAIYVNNKEYPAELVADGKYKIIYKAKKDTSGIENLTVNKVKHGVEEVQVKEERTEKIDVLKSKPKVLFDFEIDENYEAKTVTFKFKLEDSENVIAENNAYVSFGNGKFHDANGQTKVPVKVGNNEVTFVEVEEQRGYLLEVKANYDLDTNELNDILNQNDNKYENDPLIRAMAILLPPSILKVDNISAQNPENGVNSKYLNKNEKFKLSFTAQTFTQTVEGGTKPISYYPESAVINGKTYKLDKNGDTYTTQETLNGYTDAGKKEIIIDSVTLENKEVINEDIKGNIEVLKDRLSVENFKVDTTAGKALATYNLIDADNSFVNGIIEMTQTDSNKISTMEIDNTKDSYELELEPYIKYSVTIKMRYDLDEDKQDTINQDEISYGPISVEVIPEYNLKIANTEITSINNDEHKATIEFTSINNSHYKVKSIKIGNNEYVVTSLEPAEDNKYAFEYPYGESLEGKRTEIKIDSVVLENNEQVIPIENTTAIIFKDKPEITSINAEVVSAINIHSTFETKDNDNTLTKLYAVLKNQDGNKLQSKELDIKAKEVTFEGINANKYKVEIFANYDLVDGKEHIDVLLKESDLINIEPIVNIKTNSITPSKYPRKRRCNYIRL